MTSRTRTNGSLADIAGNTLSDGEQAAIKLVREYQKSTPEAGPRDACTAVGVAFSVYMAARRKQGWNEPRYDPNDVASTGEAFRFGREEAKQLEAGNRVIQEPRVQMQVQPKAEPEIREKRAYTRRQVDAPALNEEVEITIMGVTMKSTPRNLALVIHALKLETSDPTA